MTIKIGEKIKELRRKANVNQEKFAYYLGVTAQAVSKWEVEGCYPDIELLPSIANFFNITIDELMCVDIMKNQQKINTILEQAGSERSKKWYNGTIIVMLRSGIGEFPNNYELLYSLAKTLCYTKEPFVTIGEEERHKNLEESISICTRILGDCMEDMIRFRTLQVLARAYKEIGQQEKAIETATKLPLARDSRDMLLLEILDDETRSNQIVQNIWLLSDMFENTILNLANVKHKDIPEQKIELLKKIISLEEVLHEENDFIYENLRLRAAYYWISEEYIKLKDYENALDYIEKFAEHSIEWDMLPEKSLYTSIIYQGESCPKNKDFDDMKDTTLGARDLLVSREEFVPIRENVRYKKTICKLERHIKSV